MWVFGYGSLMGDGWEQSLGCEVRAEAVLQGYRRIFNKASVKNWGTRGCRCLTLNLERSEEASCVGIAFRFPEAERSRVMRTLEDREGKRFSLPELPVTVHGLGVFRALVPIYNGQNIVPPEAVPEAIRAMRLASGTSGRCIDYVNDIHNLLESLGIEDPAVHGTWTMLNVAP